MTHCGTMISKQNREVKSQKSEILFEHIYIYEIIIFIKYLFQTLKYNKNIHVEFVCIYTQGIATKVFKPLPSNHQ